MTRAFVYGGDGLGWSVDDDRIYTKELLKAAGVSAARTPISADVVHFVWWNQALRFRHLRRFSNAKWIAVVTNTIRDDTSEFDQLKDKIDLWVAANQAQAAWFKERGIRHAYQPFYVDSNIYRPLHLNKRQAAARLNMSFDKLHGRVLIGSFQRDTEANLTKPKWQKGPNTLVEILSGLRLPRDRWALVLAGPRRHWIVEECQRLSIPYVFVGSPPQAGVDDIGTNRLDMQQMSLLYNLVDLYVVSSASEGGPKAVIEGGLCNTAVISTKVGLAPDLLPSEALYNDPEEGRALVEQMIRDLEFREATASASHRRACDLLAREAMVTRWQRIYSALTQRR